MQLSLFPSKAICQGCQQEKIGVEFSHEIQKWLCDECHYPKIEKTEAEKNYPEILDVGPWGVKWRGENIAEPTDIDKNNHVAQFGFSCAECGGSGVNQEPVNHSEKCERGLK